MASTSGFSIPGKKLATFGQSGIVDATLAMIGRLSTFWSRDCCLSFGTVLSSRSKDRFVAISYTTGWRGAGHEGVAGWIIAHAQQSECDMMEVKQKSEYFRDLRACASV